CRRRARMESTAFSAEVFSLAARERIDRALDDYTRFDAGCPEALGEAIRYSLLAPGKRLRPMLVMLATEACRGFVDAALPAACAVEMVHAYSLVHDDLPAMDDDDLRRGRPTCHKAFGEATRILVGVAWRGLAFETLASGPGLPADPAIRLELVRLLAIASGTNVMAGGPA